jgi:hypothetical protein
MTSRILHLIAGRGCGLLLSTCLLAMLAQHGLAESDNTANYDNERPRKITTVVPAELIEGELWKLGEEATPYQGLFQFQVNTQWGNFPVYGEAMLRLRLREFRAIAELQDVSSTEAALKGAGSSIKKSAVRLGHSIVHPKQFTRELPQGSRRMFTKLDRYRKKIQKALSGSDEDGREGEGEIDQGEPIDHSSSSEKAALWLARKYGGVGSKSRRRARDVGVDPYTKNELLADELERLSRAEAIGSVSSKFLMPMMAGGIGLLADAANIAYTQNWREIFTYNAQLMRDMGASEESILDFEVSQFYTPMTQTLLIAMLDSIEGAENRWVAIEQASLLQNESEALFFLESIMLAEWYHREQAPLKAFVPNTLIPVATNQSGNLVAFTAADYFYWTVGAETAARDFTAAYAEYPGGREFVTADYISPLAKGGIEALGWSVRSGLRQSYDVEVPWGAQDHE